MTHSSWTIKHEQFLLFFKQLRLFSINQNLHSLKLSQKCQYWKNLCSSKKSCSSWFLGSTSRRSTNDNKIMVTSEEKIHYQLYLFNNQWNTSDCSWVCTYFYSLNVIQHWPFSDDCIQFLKEVKGLLSLNLTDCAW